MQGMGPTSITLEGGLAGRSAEATGSVGFISFRPADWGSKWGELPIGRVFGSLTGSCSSLFGRRHGRVIGYIAVQTEHSRTLFHMTYNGLTSRLNLAAHARADHFADRVEPPSLVGRWSLLADRPRFPRLSAGFVPFQAREEQISDAPAARRNTRLIPVPHRRLDPTLRAGTLLRCSVRGAITQRRAYELGPAILSQGPFPSKPASSFLLIAADRKRRRDD